MRNRIIFLSIFFFSNLCSVHLRKTEPEDDSPCLRPCTVESAPMICHYKFNIEWYQSLSRACYDCPRNTTDCLRPHCVPTDGTNRPVLVVNRQMPGPSIQACYGDKIVVDVVNRMQSEETTIHWHGHHQRDNPYMDGVPYVTQCPIPSGGSFRYEFSANHIGTHFWHSHSGNQRGEGVYGPMIIRMPKATDVHGSRYDFDLPSHVMVVTDWLHETGQSTFTHAFHSNGKTAPNSLLVNGLGYFINSTTGVGVPPARFTVNKGYKYRFRVINAEFLVCPIEISVDNHTLSVISTDGFDIEPVTVDSIVTYSGERFDFVINANQEIGNYWMRFRGLLSCSSGKAHQVAVLSYVGTDMEAYPPGEPDYESAHKEGLQLNSVNEEMNKEEAISIPELNSTSSDDLTLKEEPEYQFYVNYDFYNVSNTNYFVPGLYDYNDAHPKFRMTTPQLNHISLALQSFPLLSGRDKLTEDMFCNETTVKNCENEFCQCTHVLQVRLNSVVEVILVDSGKRFDSNHPFHLHGNAFRVIGMERLGSSVTLEEIKERDRLGLLQRKLEKAPLKDTVTIPDGGYTIIRFHAYNPGYWLFHCHIDFHAEIGMALVFKVGEHSDLPPVPKNFPECNHWTFEN